MSRLPRVARALFEPGPGIGIALAALVMIAGALSLDQYNATWDEALGDYFFGERYWSFFTSFDPVYLDVRADPYPPERRPDLGLSPFRGRPWEYYPVANVLAAATSELLSRRLGLLDAFDGFHAVDLWLAGLFVLVVHGFLRRRFGLLAATAAVVFLFGSPRVVFAMMANIKDFPSMVFWSFAACAFLAAWEAGSARGLWAAGCLVGLSLGVKANALFLPVLFGLVVVAGGLPPAWRGRRPQLVAAAIAAALTAPLVMVAAWPYLWADPVGRFARHLEYIGGRKAFTSARSMAPVLEAIVLTTPPLFLCAALAGLGWVLIRLVRGRHQRDARFRAELFLIAWIVASLCRFALPQAVNFDGVRHFLELFPAMAALAGIAVAALARAVAARWSAEAGRRRLLAAALTLPVLMPGVWAVAACHPFEVCYWNVFAGGYSGARARDLPQAADYWGASYRLGLRWLDQHASPDAYLAVPVVEHAVRLVASERLRPDLRLLPVTTPFSPRIAPERLAATRDLARSAVVYVMFVERRDWANELMLDCLRQEPEMVWRLDGAPVLSIYRYQPP